MEAVMYHMVRSLGAKAVLQRELPAGAAAFLIAELFYKFHSFALETLAFLATWWVLSWVEKILISLLMGKETGHGQEKTR
jgi:hypothetical protein